MKAQYFLSINGGQNIEIDEPIGYDSATTKLTRDMVSHGMSFEYNVSELQFIGKAYDLIKEQYELNRSEASVQFSAYFSCDDLEAYELEYSGKLDFKTYRESEAENNSIFILTSQQDAEVSLANRKSEDVALNLLTAFDGKVLTEYEGLDKDVLLKPMDVILNSKAVGIADSPRYTISIPKTAELQTLICGNQVSKMTGFLTYTLQNSVLSELGTLDTSGFACYREIEDIMKYGTMFNYLPNVNMSDNVLDIRIKGRFRAKKYFNIGPGSNVQSVVSARFNKITLWVDNYPDGNIEIGPGDFDSIIMHYDSYNCSSGNNLEVEFDRTLTIPFNYASGTKFGIAGFVEAWIYNPNYQYDPVAPEFEIMLDEVSFVRVSGRSTFDATVSKTAMIHEAASRIVEVITNGELSVESQFFGRPDSTVIHQTTLQPLDEPTVGIGGMLSILNGYQIRKALKSDNSKPYISISLKTLMEQLQAIYNIGYGVEYSQKAEALVLRIEDFKYFYDDEIILEVNCPTKLDRIVDGSELYNKIECGYSTWETETFNGQDAFLTTRTYSNKTNIIDNSLVKLVKFIADGYAFEATRRKQLDRDTKDFKYDEKVFALCLSQDEGGIVYESENGGGVSNLISPDTVYNTRISPARIAMRWANRIYQMLSPSRVKDLIFQSGTGNFIATTQISNDGISAGTELSEGLNISAADYAGAKDVPYLKSETLKFDWPLSFEEWKTIKSNPRGVILVNGETTYLKSVEYKQIEGKAVFVTIPLYS